MVKLTVTWRDIAYYIIMIFVIVLLLITLQKAVERDFAVREALDSCILYYEEVIDSMTCEQILNTKLFTERYNASNNNYTMP